MEPSRRSILRVGGLAVAGAIAGCRDGTAGAVTDVQGQAGGLATETTTDSTDPATAAENDGESTSTRDGSATGTGTQSETATPEPLGPGSYDHFESGDIADAYVGDRDSYEITSDAITDGYAIQVNETHAPLSHGEARTPRGYEYRARVRVEGAPNLRVNVQNVDTPRRPGCYSMQATHTAGEFRLYRVSDNTDVLLDTIDHDVSVGEVYVPRLRIGTETVQLAVDDADGTEIGRTEAVSDQWFDGGTYGLHTYGDTGSVWDDIRRVAL